MAAWHRRGVRYLVGGIFVVAGLLQLVFRRWLARFNARGQQIRYGADSRRGRLFGGPAAVRASTVGGAVAGLVVAVAGVLIMAGVFGHF